MEAQYLDQSKFPLTTQPGLNFQQQKLRDSLNYQELSDHLDQGKQLNSRQQQILAEFKQKQQLLGK